MGSASARKRLVRHLGDAPDLADSAEHPAQIPVCLDHAEISERSLEDVLDAGDAPLRQIGGNHRIARVKADLQPEQHGALLMRLHGAAQLAVDVTKQRQLPVGVEAEHLAEPGGGGEDAGSGGSEKTQTRGAGNAEMTGGIDAEHDGSDQIASTDAANSIGMGHDRGQTHGHRMYDGS